MSVRREETFARPSAQAVSSLFAQLSLRIVRGYLVKA
jgi:hypothetical protein